MIELLRSKKVNMLIRFILALGLVSLCASCENLKSISRGDKLLDKCPYCIVEDDEPGSKLIECNDLNKTHKILCDDKLDEIGDYQ